jgi:transcriptional regulator with XRE-family HTH domain
MERDIMTTQEDKINRFVGKKIKSTRIKLGVTQVQVGKEAGCTGQQIQKYENGTNRIPAGKLFLLSRAVNVPVQYFFPTIPNQQQEPMPPQTVTLLRLINRIPAKYYEEVIGMMRAFVRVSNSTKEQESDE